MIRFSFVVAFWVGSLWADSTLFYNGKVFESYRDTQPKSELLVENGRVVSQAKKIDRRVDLKGRFVFPALADAHAHLFDLGRQKYDINLGGSKSPAEIVARIRKYIRSHPPTEVLSGSGWDQSEWPGQKFADRTVLDAISNEIPIILYRVDGHAAWVNTAALKKSGIWDAGKDPAGGKILRNEDGSASGVLIDNAMEPLTSLLTLSEKEAATFLKDAVREALSYGITTVHDAGIDPKYVSVFRQALKSGKVNFRFYEMVFKPELSPILNESENRLTVRAVKLLADGAMGSRGAAFDKPYNDDPENSGLMLLTNEELVAKIKEADSKGFQIAVHAIGNKATRLTVDAMEKALGDSIASKRPRLEHAQVLDLETITKMKKLGVIASMQPTHCTSDMKWVVDRIGKERARYAYAWRTVLDKGIPLAFGSDAPVESINPWAGLYSALTRSDGKTAFNGEEKISAMEALTAFSEGAAYAAFQEKDLGTLSNGKLADFIVMTKNPLALAPEEVKTLLPDETYVGGKRAWKRP